MLETTIGNIVHKNELPKYIDFSVIKKEEWNMKRALCLTAAVLLAISMMGCDTNPSASETVKTTETAESTATAGTTAKPINTVPPQEAAEMLEKTKAALDEFIKIKTKDDVEEINEAYPKLIEKIRQDDAGVAVANVPAIDESKMDLGTIVRIFSLLSSVYYRGEEVKELYPTAVRGDGERVYFVFDVKDGIRYYLFYDNSVDEMYSSLGYALLVGRAHTSEEFEALKKGDSISKVEEIDPVAGYYRERNKSISIHYLEDGLAFIKYVGTEDNKDYVIDSIEIKKEHKYHVQLENGEYDVNCEINPLDLPQ